MDISTCTGLAMVGEGEDRGKTIHLPKERGLSRLQLIADQVIQTMGVWEPDLIVIEGYAYAINIRSFITLVEVGTAIRLALHSMHLPWMEVPVTVLKKWATGKGNASKDEMALAVKNKWGFESPSNDIVDAYALAQMGQLGTEHLLTISGVLKGD